ncbi:unnamed protein product [Symbiodinium sp. CCMP2592]|nr:unnamed protein product [Symbiodinium sp. CCMP2592]
MPDLGPQDAERACQERKITVVIENPYRSFFWHVPQITKILEHEDAVSVRSDFCMFGGQRLKRTALLSNSPLVQSLAAQCDGKHTHAAWGRVDGDFVTKQESAYPTLFCKTFVMALTGHLRDSGCVDEREVQELKGSGPASAKVLSTQERGRLVAPQWMPAGKIKGLDAGTAEEVKEMLEAAHYPDKAVADDMAKGFNLVGHLDLPAGWDVASSSSFIEELWQKSMEEGKKVRPIDDLSQSFLNAAFGSAEVRTGLQGKTIDLKSAYRQLPLSSEALEMSVIAVKNPETGEVQFFRLLCLPFGAVAAVHAFIRVSLALCYLGQTFGLLPWSAFYDDFTLLSTQDLASSSEKSANFLLDLLGFDFDKDGDKAQPFRSVFRALGVEFNLQDEEGKSFQVASTKESEATYIPASPCPER